MKNKSSKGLNYVTEAHRIKKLLKKAFREKRSVKINYYSLSSDEVRYRIIDIYKMHKNCIIAYCYLRNEERTFVIDRINKIALLDNRYNLPENWNPESIIVD